MSVDPIGFEAGDVNLYRYVGNRATRIADPNGNTPLDLLAKLRGDHIYRAVGMQAGMIVQLEVWGIDIPMKASAATGIYFFPDSC